MSSTEATFLARLKTQGWRLSHTNVDENNDAEDSEESGIRCYFSEIEPSDSCRRAPRHLSNTSNGQNTSNNRTSFEDEELTEEEDETAVDEENLNRYLAPPKPNRLFLLSPPASPPVGWQPRPEAEPLVNYELLNALACMEPGMHLSTPN